MAKQKMLAKIKYDYKKRSKDIVAELEIDFSRFERQFERGQYDLDSMIMTDMIPFMPMVSGVFINVTRLMSAAIAGTGKVYAAAPPGGRMLYEGKTMVDIETGSPFARKGAKKVLVSQYSGKTNAKENLEYSKAAHPNVTSHWFVPTKKAYGKEWIRKTKQTAGGG